MRVPFHPMYQTRFTCWADLEAAIERLPDAKEKGDAFEQFVFLYLQFHRELYEIKTVYMREEIPEEVKRLLRLEKSDYGVDGVIVRTDGKLATYQAKFRAGRRPPSYRELATFWAESEQADLYYIFANCERLPELAHKNQKQQPVVLVDAFIDLDDAFFENVHRFVHGQPVAQKVKFTPRPYQQTMIDEVVKGFRTSDRGKLIAACGTGKTATAMWIMEALNAQNTLFVAPSLSLIKQTLEGWVEQANRPFHFLCVCSDPSVASALEEEDEYELDVENMNVPVTTDPLLINQFLEREDVLPKIIFSTYQSLDAVAFAIMNMGGAFSFDLGIFDEAHRTAGAKNSQMFVYAHRDEYIPIAKRLFMTATERLVTPRIKSLAEKAGQVVFSMDDQEQYGETLSRLNFGQAIREGIIADYKIVICAVAESEMYDMIRHNQLYLSTDVGEDTALTTMGGLFKQVLLAKAVKELDIKKIITFHSSVKNAKLFINGSSSELPLSRVFDQMASHIGDEDIYFSHVNGSMNAGERKQIFQDFKSRPYGVVSNAKCLTEGVDVPVIDAIYFADPKNSTIDIVQAVGRALRKTDPNESKTAYIIIPVIIPTGTLSFGGINAEIFDTLHTVVQALRDQDQHLADIIDELNYQASLGKNPGNKQELEKKIVILPSEKLQIHELQDSIYLRIAEVNSRSTVFKSAMKRAMKEEDRRGSMERVFRSVGDYNVDAYKTSLVLPTLELFTRDDEVKSSTELMINHNNLSHAERIGAVERVSKSQFCLTQIGRFLRRNPQMFDAVFQEQMLKYYSENKAENTILFPYRAIFKVLAEFESITKFEFLYCLYSLRSTTDSAVRQAIERIYYLRETYPRLHILNEENQSKVLEMINEKFNVSFSYKDIWTSRTTTYNQFNYFKKHLWTFSNIFENDLKAKEEIKVYPGSRTALVELLERTRQAERLAEERNESELRNYYTRLVLIE